MTDERKLMISEFASYSYHEVQMTWKEARDECHKNNHDDLASFLTQEEANSISQSLVGYGKNINVWIGLKEKWVWTDGNPIARMSWHSILQDLCASLYVSNWLLQTKNCTERHHFICKSMGKS